MSFKAIIEADIRNFNQNIDKARVEMDRLEKSTTRNLSKIGDSFISIGKKASILSAGLVAVGTKSFLMAADFEDAVGATEQIFKDSADAVSSWAEGLDTSFGIAKKEALEYSNLMGSMLINIGNLTEKEASKQSAKLIELAGDLTAMYGGTTQDAVRALTGALKGNNAMLDNYGMAVNESLIKSKALEMGLIGTTGEMSLQAKQAATLALIYEQTGAAQGQAAREADGASGAMRALRTEITNLSTELGEVLLPIITPMIGKLRDIVAGFREMSPEMQKTIVTVGAVTAAIGPLLVVTGKILKALPLIKAALVALTGPIGLVGGAIILVAANFEDVVKNVTRMWNTFSSGISSSVKALVSLVTLDFKGFWTNTKAMFSNGVKYVVEQMEFMGGKLEWVLRKLGLEEWANRVNASFGGINLDQSALEAALAANELTGSMGAAKEAIEETIQPTIYLAKLNDTLAKSQERVVENLKAMRLVIPKKEEYSLFNELFTQSGNELILNPTIEPNIDAATLKSKMYEAVKGAMGDLSEGIRVITIDLSQMLATSLADVFGSVATAIMEGDNVMGALGASLLGTLGGIMVDLGKMVIVTGKAIETVKAALKNLGGIGAIAAGAALIAIGSAFSAGARKLGASMGGASGGGYSAAPSLNNQPTYGPSQYRGQYQDDFVVTFVQKGSDLVGVLDTAEQRRRRT